MLVGGVDDTMTLVSSVRDTYDGGGVKNIDVHE